MSSAEVSGRIFVPGDATVYPARLRRDEGDCVVEFGLERVERADWSAVEISARLAQLPRTLTFPSGHIFETADNDAIDLISPGTIYWGNRWIEHIERRMTLVAALVVVLGLVLAATFKYALPTLGDFAAQHVPESLFKSYSEPYKIRFRKNVAHINDPKLEKSVRRLFIDLKARYPKEHPDFSICSNKDAGLNAFALPDGAIFISDELINKLKDLNLVEAVLLHEIGHVHYRHIIRNLSEAALVQVALLAVGMSWDETGLPAGLATNGFSREAEYQADDFAKTELSRSGRNGAALADALELIKSKSDGTLEFLSTHPSSQHRTERLRK